MKFKFCGGTDAPDWLLVRLWWAQTRNERRWQSSRRAHPDSFETLSPSFPLSTSQAEISTISKLSSIRVKLLVGQLVKRVVDGDIDYAKLQRFATGTIGEGDVQAAVAALHFILTGAAKHDVEEGALAKELEQLGVPREHSDAVCKPYAKDKEAMRARLTRTTLSVDRLTNGVRWDVKLHVPGWERKGTCGDTELSNGERGGEAAGGEQVALRVGIEVTTERLGDVRFDCSEEKFRTLLLELKAARGRLDK